MAEVYDGFISYSHAADDLLAPRLQAGLQRFAKPWWKRRALRVFRDEASLSANPHLWSSITDALDGSEWFVLLLSEDAAGSEWVNREVEYWLANKPAGRILPVVTDGEFSWEDGDVSVSSTAAPPALSGVFEEEPRWVDLRWARTDEHLDLNNPRFSDAIADVASALRGIPKDELASEEVRQHRRTIRTAWAAGVVVLLLGIAATVGAVVALDQSVEARNQRDDARRLATAEAEARAEAETNEQRALDAEAQALQLAEAEANARADAEEQRDRADDQAELARQSEAEANRQAMLARAGQLAASAIGVLGRDPELALLLTLEAADEAPPGSDLLPEARIALRRALNENRLVDRFQVADGGILSADFTPDGSGLVVSSAAERSVTLWDLESRVPVWTYVDESTSDTFLNIAASPRGDVMALGIVDLPVAGGAAKDDGLPGRIVILDAASGEPFRTIEGSGCATATLSTDFGEGFSPDGRFLVFSDGVEGCRERGAEAADDWISLIDTETWVEAHRFDIGAAESLSFTADMATIAVTAAGARTEILSFPSLESVSTIEHGGVWAVISPDGSRLAVRNENDLDLRAVLYDVATGLPIDHLDGLRGFVLEIEFTPDNRSLVVSGTDSVGVFDASRGGLLFTLETPLTNSTVSGDGSLLAAPGEGGQVELYRLTELDAGLPLMFGENSPRRHVQPNVIGEGDPVVATVIEFLPDSRPDLWLLAIDAQSGSVVDGVLEDGSYARLPDGRVVVPNLRGTAVDDGSPVVGPLHVWDPQAGTLTPLDTCAVSEAEIFGEDPPGDFYFCVDGRPLLGEYLAASATGSELAVGALSFSAGTEHIVEIFDANSLELIRTVELTTRDSVDGNVGMTVLGDGWLMLLEGNSADVAGNSFGVFDSHTGDRITTLDDPPSWRGATVSTADGRHLFLSANDGSLWQYDTSTWEVVQTWQVQNGRARGLALSPDETLIASTGEDDFVMIWDVEARTLVDQIPVPFPSDVTWADESTLGVLLQSGEWVVVSLLDEPLLERAAEQLTRTFTSDECRQFGITDCPTLIEIKQR